MLCCCYYFHSYYVCPLRCHLPLLNRLNNSDLLVVLLRTNQSVQNRLYWMPVYAAAELAMAIAQDCHQMLYCLEIRWFHCCYYCLWLLMMEYQVRHLVYHFSFFIYKFVWFFYINVYFFIFLQIRIKFWHHSIWQSLLNFFLIKSKMFFNLVNFYTQHTGVLKVVRFLDILFYRSTRIRNVFFFVWHETFLFMDLFWFCFIFVGEQIEFKKREEKIKTHIEYSF